MRVLKKIPKMSLVPRTEASTKVVKALILCRTKCYMKATRDCSEYLAGVFRQMPLSSVVGVLAARLQVKVVQAPVLQLLAVVLDTDLRECAVIISHSVALESLMYKTDNQLKSTTNNQLM